ncbi:MAG: mandelate racemase/muconate lactonizing enzyme family protein [Acidobacteria bacterium]|nr:mandelate racemase/muconate lactonizing enzyme family protein [Acidobacteriota bacterium]MBI3470350.1 mandelate racemase/muconate lactonizing enzyme family protein [Candidatus Solibacter usitatus]
MNRRRLLQAAALSPAAARAAADPAISRIKITGLEIFRIPVNRRGDWLLVRLHTSAGISGIGEASHGRPEQDTVSLLGKYFEFLKGRGIFEAEPLRAEAEPGIAGLTQAGACALSGLEQCLWDIQGKAVGVPACDLFGGRLQTRLRNYANINRSTEERTPAGFARMAEAAVRAGFDAIKLAPFDDMPRLDAAGDVIERFTRLGIERAAAVRKAIGPDRDLLVDAHSHFDAERGLRLPARLEALNLFWLEEVTPPRPLHNLAAINRIAKMQTAGGESIYGARGFYPYIAAQAVDIVMPDVKYCGGMLELKKIAALAEGAGLQVAPHGPASPVGNVAAAHVCATMSNFLILEFSFGEVDWRADLIEPREELVKGYLNLSGRPGLGITLNEKLAGPHRISSERA